MAPPILAVALLLLGSTLSAREWRSVDGRRLAADFVSADAKSVTLRRTDGRKVTVPTAMLSAADRLWIRTESAFSAAAGREVKNASRHVFACDFEVSPWETGWNLGNPNLPRNLAVVAADPASAKPPSSTGNRVLEVVLRQGTHYGADFEYDFAASGSEPDEAVLSYRLCFADGFNSEAVQGGKLPGFACVHGAAGSAGRKVNGADAWSARGAYWKPDADGRIPIGFYVYHADMTGDYGDSWYFDRPLERGKWYDVRLYVKLNSPASVAGAQGRRDGELQAWLDGEHVFEKTGLRFRDVDRLKIRSAWFHFYHGGGRPASQDYRLWIDDVRIGALDRD